MTITITVHQTLDSDVMFYAAMQAGLNPAVYTKESLEALDGKEIFIDLNEQIKINPNVLLGLIQQMKTTFNTAPTEPPAVDVPPVATDGEPHEN